MLRYILWSVGRSFLPWRVSVCTVDVYGKAIPRFRGIDFEQSAGSQRVVRHATTVVMPH